MGQTSWTRVREIVNWLNLSTPLGLAVARLGGAHVVRHERGTWLAGGYRWGFPVAGAFTVGNVILSRRDVEQLRTRPRLLRHEDRHCTQYAFVVGPLLLPLYGIFALLSWVVAADWHSVNPFERLAGLEDGDYPPPTTRIARRR
ncbi:hypothetical protein ACHAAC_02255 [Aeromicrobium sp. CF4.19]|uniref:hypothetical protein n=1 Tax=Aeromicrobium sp. CF4.19 TaxID=3373082 RepID=UPI003EE6334B